jgi:hypothetical protein
VRGSRVKQGDEFEVPARIGAAPTRRWSVADSQRTIELLRAARDVIYKFVEFVEKERASKNSRED